MREIVNGMRDAGGLRVAGDAERSAAVGRIYRWFATWRDDGRFERINRALVMADCEPLGRGANPLAAIIGNQSVETTKADGLHGYDAGKKINGYKRHAFVDTGVASCANRIQ